jgi:hypothetical protein
MRVTLAQGQVQFHHTTNHNMQMNWKAEKLISEVKQINISETEERKQIFILCSLYTRSLLNWKHSYLLHSVSTARVE